LEKKEVLRLTFEKIFWQTKMNTNASLILLVLAAVLAAVVYSKNCACPRIYKPVCDDTGKYVPIFNHTITKYLLQQDLLQLV